MNVIYLYGGSRKCNFLYGRVSKMPNVFCYSFLEKSIFVWRLDNAIVLYVGCPVCVNFSFV